MSSGTQKIESKYIKPNTTGVDNPAGAPGEHLVSELLAAAGIALTTATAANIVSLSLPPGDWEVSAASVVTASGANLTAVSSSITPTSATLNTLGKTGTVSEDGITATNIARAIAPKRFNTKIPLTVYLVISATFAAGTAKGYGTIKARRVA